MKHYPFSLLSALIVVALSGCNDASPSSFPLPCEGENCSEIIPPEPIPPEPEPEPEPIPPGPDPVVYNGTLVSSGVAVKGDLVCNGKTLDTPDFPVNASDTFSCQFGDIQLAEFTAPSSVEGENTPQRNLNVSFDIANVQGENATKLLQSIDACINDEAICLEEINSFDLVDIYLKVKDDKEVEAFLKAKDEEATQEVGNAPSSHVDSNLVPAVTPGSSNDLNNAFVSPEAEESTRYTPSAEAQVLTVSILTDNNGKPLSGVDYYSTHSTGKTNEKGEMEYLWGDTIRFGIDTFNFGALVGNQVSYKLTDITDNEIEKTNIQSLLDRYAMQSAEGLEITPLMQTTFAQYPNVINDLIKLSLPNGGLLDGTNFSLPNEFEAQFEQGLTKEIDLILKGKREEYSSEKPRYLFEKNAEVTQALNALFKDVGVFHVFHDNTSFYGASGFARGMSGLNLSNRAFPVMMPRNDINYRIPFGQPQAWTRESKPYIAQWPGITMPSVPLVDKDMATFGFPFITAGMIGKGKVLFMGNSMYPSILSCPNNYWANTELKIDPEAKDCTLSAVQENEVRDDKGSMKTFFDNLFAWFVPNTPMSDIQVATNIEKSSASNHSKTNGLEYDFFIHPQYGFAQVEHLTQGQFSGVSPEQTPILILQAYETRILSDGTSNRFIADLEKPRFSQEDITALIKYISDGGNIILMDAIDGKVNPEPLGRLVDAAGMSVGGMNTVPTKQENCGSSHYCPNSAPNVHVKGHADMVVYSRLPDVNGKPLYSVQEDGTVVWAPPAEMKPLEIPTYTVEKKDEQGNPVLGADGSPVLESKVARIFVKTEEEKSAAIAEIKKAFEGVSECTHAYEYEIDCIETRKGEGGVARGTYGRKDFDRYPVSADVLESMINAANLGKNLHSLFEHERYYRTKGKKGTRLSTLALNQTFDNTAMWLWNDNDYQFDPTLGKDELGFETLVGFLNCYTSNQHQGGALCPEALKSALYENKMIHENGELMGQLNPSYPLNYMEKPLTRIMLGRSFWDHEIKVDVSQYPGRTPGIKTTSEVLIETKGKGVSYSAGNNQSTGLWAPQLSEVTVTGGVEANITVMMADDLTGMPEHETRLNRPPRMRMNFHHDGRSTQFKVPYGGLISVQPQNSTEAESPPAAFTFSGVEIAAWWKDGSWTHPLESAVAPLAEIDTGSFIYTLPKDNLKETDLNQFASDSNRFFEAANAFYGRDETTDDGLHRRFTYEQLKGFRHRYVEDVQISIGVAHSGYPVMGTAFSPTAQKIAMDPTTSWLLWHEIGHNLAAKPFMAPGSTEVTNNILALYMQELDDGRTENPAMIRIKTDIQKAPLWLAKNKGHAWSHGGAGMRLVMFGQLKIWAENHFKLAKWYPDASTLPSLYGSDEGWNLFKLMHRKARGDTQGDLNKNHCSAEETGLASPDLMMVCASYVSGFDLSGFFTEWNVGEQSYTPPNGNKFYEGGISQAGKTYLTSLNLASPSVSPLSINALP